MNIRSLLLYCFFSLFYLFSSTYSIHPAVSHSKSLVDDPPSLIQQRERFFKFKAKAKFSLKLKIPKPKLSFKASLCIGTSCKKKRRRRKPQRPRPIYRRPPPPPPVRSGKDVEDCVACRYMWLQVEEEVGESNIKDVRASFIRHCINGQKSMIFYDPCSKMYDQVDKMAWWYTKSFSVNQLCENALLCR